MNSLKKNRSLILFFVLCTVVLSYGFFEWKNYTYKVTSEDKLDLAKNSIELSVEKFEQFLFEFTNQTTEFTDVIKSKIEKGTPYKDIYSSIIEDQTFWGRIVYKQGEPLIWDGFIPDEYPKTLVDENEAFHISVSSENNTTFLHSMIPFFIEEMDSVYRFDVYTRKKISQENILNIGKDLELHPQDLFSTPLLYPVEFAFTNFTFENELFSQVLSTASSDSVGKVYALDSGYQRYEKASNKRIEIWRAFFLFSILLLIGTIIFYFSQSIGGGKGLFVQIVAYTTVWLLIKTIYPLIEMEERILDFFSNIFLIDYLIDSFFALLIAISLIPFLLKQQKIEFFNGNLRLFTVSLSIGCFGGYLTYSFLLNTAQVVLNSTISVVDLELIPSLLTLVFYISTTVFFSSLFVLFITVNWFIFKNYSEYLLFILGGLLVGFFTFIVLSKFTFINNDPTEWVLAISSLFFLITLVFSIYLFKRTPSFLYSSKLRLLIFISYLATCFMYIAFANGNTNRQNQRMLQVSSEFSEDEEIEIRSITVELLNTLTEELSEFSLNAFNEAIFDQVVQKVINPDWLEYTISIQLINDEGSRFADYTTSLSPPQWSTAFRIEELEFPFEDEQIQPNNLRPILRNKPINTINANYSSFIRGWIPLFENNSNKRIGWILCSVYRELPQLDRPLRTVVSSRKPSYMRETLVSTEYQNGISTRSSIHGVPLKIYTPGRLTDEIIAKTNSDSIFITSSLTANDEIKELFVKNNESNIVRVATKKVDVKQHTFSFLRFFFVLVISGILFMIVFSWKENWRILGSERKFKDRLIDRFILASFVCLLTLVGASYFVLEVQNNYDVQDRLFSRLDNLTTNLESELGENVDSPSQLQKITSVLDVDAALYENGILVNSTTSQIFAQHILPNTMPWDIYNRISNNESNEELETIMLDGQKMLIGYKPWLDGNNHVVGIAAIPTFQKAPKFYDRLLSTTSYLLAFYTLIFGLLMLAVGFISSQLTFPLEAVSEALKRISEGNLNTTLPVRSKDEIGTLTSAYNVMAKRLKKVQKELAETEREAAWKEMAQQVAHEIKNPLTPMKLNLQHLERQMKGTEIDLESIKPKVSKIASNMIKQIDSLNNIASDFSKFAKPMEYELKPIDLNRLITSVAEMYDTNEGFKLIKDLSKEHLPILGAAEELRRVFVNLIKNAKEALQENGQITIHSFSDADQVSAFVTIIDNGEGIKVEDQERIFVPNFSTKSSGTGLGLAITKKIIEEHNGEISFISTSGQGSSFTIRIPLSIKDEQ